MRFLGSLFRYERPFAYERESQGVIWLERILGRPVEAAHRDPNLGVLT
jgi:hypothetical protein